MRVTEKQARAKIRAFRLLEILLKRAGVRLSVAQRDFRQAKILSDQDAIKYSLLATQEAFAECGRISNRVRELGIRKRVA